MSPVAEVQVCEHVRRPTSMTTFVAFEVSEGEEVVRVTGHWRGSAQQRQYTLPWRSVVALRWVRGDAEAAA
jgi:hypothetical protein